MHAFSATTRAQYERQILIDSLTHLRDTRSTLEKRCERIEVDVNTYKQEMLRIGNERKRRCVGKVSAPFTKIERLKFQFNATKRDMSVRELETIHNLLLAVERQISVMANADLYREGMYALRAGVTVGAKYQQAIEGYTQLLDDMDRQQTAIADVQHEIGAHANVEVDDDAILEELEQLSDMYTSTANNEKTLETAPTLTVDPMDYHREQELMSI